MLAKLGLYHKAVQDFNVAHPNNLFVPAPWTIVLIMMPIFPDEAAGTIIEDDVLWIMLHNCIPLEWADHAYMYGVVYLKHQFFHSSPAMP